MSCRSAPRPPLEQRLATDLGPQRLLAGPPRDGRPEALDAHVARLGAVPLGGDARDLITILESSGLLGRGGAGFPVGRKWRAVAGSGDEPAIVVANGAEGEPGSAKDRTLMTHRPHLVLDGALLAAEAIGADEVVVYVGVEHEAAVASMRRAIEERRAAIRPAIQLATAPVSYVAGEASAVVHHITSGDARPTTTPPRVSEHGVRGRPTLVQNVESLAYAALIARFGVAWYRSVGRLESPGTALVTVTGAVTEPGVREIELGTPVGEVAEAMGASSTAVGAVVLGGYFGTWGRVDDAWALPLDPAVMRRQGMSFGCGIVGLLPADTCGVSVTAQIMGYMANESAGQCGPCVFGLRAIFAATKRVADGDAGATDLADIRRWMTQVSGRGACRHPDGAVQLLASALDVFDGEFDQHAQTGRCSYEGRMRIDAA